MEMINRCYSNGSLSKTHRNSIITLILKDKDNQNNLDYWRPISLLNVDYKIISKCISLRLRKVLPSIIHMDQTCSIKNRTIIDNIHLLRNVIDYVNQKNLKCVMLNLDQAKAFDKVSHEYMIEVLKAFGFGDSFISWVEVLYNNIESRVLVNGHLSSSFPVTRSLRQGCPLSPLLYVLCVEPFAARLRSDPHISGLSIPSHVDDVRVSQYADDTTLILTTERSIQKVLVLAELYGLASGANLNKNKSNAMWLGQWEGRRDTPYGLNWVECSKIMGIYFSNNIEHCTNINWNKCINKLRATLNDAKYRNLYFIGSALYSNVMALSKVWYQSSTLLMNTNQLTSINKCMFNFIWNGRAEWIKRETLYLNKYEGGINLVNVESKLKAFQVKHVLTLIDTKYNAKWKWFACYWIGFNLRKFDKELGSNLIPHSVDRPAYYDRCMKVFKEVENILGDNKNIIDVKSVKEIYGVFLNHKKIIPRIVTINKDVNFKKVYTNCWMSSIPPEIKNFNYKMINNVLPINHYLVRYGMARNNLCTLCNSHVETLTHLFLKCHFVHLIWLEVMRLCNELYNVRLQIDEQVILWGCFRDARVPEDKALPLIATARWIIWKHRNRVKYEHSKPDREKLVSEFISAVCKDNNILDLV